MIARTLAAALALALAGCGREPADPPPAQAPQPAPPPEAVQPGTSADLRPIAPAPEAEWIGDWAATPALCQGGRWRLARDRIVTDGETTCAVSALEPQVLGQTRLTLACDAQGMKSEEFWLLDPRDDGSLQVIRTTGSDMPVPVTLRRC